MENDFVNWSRGVSAANFAYQRAPLTEQHARLLMKVKHFPSVLQELMQRVRPYEEALHIRRNLEHSTMRTHLVDNLPAMEKQREDHLGQSIEEAKKALSAETEYMKLLALEEEKLNYEEREMWRHLALLSVAVKGVRQKIIYRKQEKIMVEKLPPKFRTCPSVPDASINQQKVNVDLMNVLSNLKHGRVNMPVSNFGKLEEYKLIKKLLQNHSPHFIIKSLHSVTNKGLSSIQQGTRTIDLAADTDKLKKEFVSRCELAEKRKLGVLQNSEFLMVEMHGKHVTGHYNNSMKRRAIQRSADCLEKKANIVNSLVKESKVDDQLKAEVAKLYATSLEVAGLKAALNTSSALERDIQVKENVALGIKKNAIMKHSQLERIDKTLNNEIVELKGLIIEASQIRNSLEKRNSLILASVEEHLGHIVLPIPILKDSFSQEVAMALCMPLEHLRFWQTLNGNATPILKPNECVNSEVRSLSSVTPYLTSSVGLVENIRNMKRNLRLDESLLSEIVDLMDYGNLAIKNCLSDSSAKDLCEDSKIHDKSQEKMILPLLEMVERMNSDTDLALINLEEAIAEWWAQPGSVVKEYLT